jgi:hypothetical protein
MDSSDEVLEHDRALRDWFAARGWPVAETFDVDEDMRAWSHRGARAQYTLYVTKEVLDRHGAQTLPTLLDQRFADQALREMPDGEAVLCYRRALLVISYYEGRDD